jgi:putative endopeptidase
MKKILLILPVAALFACQQAPKEEAIETPAKPSGFELSNLDTTVAPCDNFYQYAIGGWLKDNPIPSTESRWSSFNLVTEGNNTRLRAILDEYSAMTDAKKGSKEQQIGDLYKSAMDSTKQNELGAQPIQPMLAEIAALSTKEAFITLSAQYATKGIGSMFGMYVGQDDKNSAAYITHIYQSGLTLPDRDYYLNDDAKSVEIREKYVDHIVKMFTLLGDDEAIAKSKAATILKIETDLAKVSMSRVERRDPNKTYNKFAFDDFKTKFKGVDWDTYVSTLGLKGVDNIIVSQPDFITKAIGYIKGYSLDELKTYMSWSVVDNFAAYLGENFDQQNFSFFSTTLRGTKEMKPRWKRSLGTVNGSLGELLGKAFVERHFPEESKAQVSEMVENLRAAFKVRIENLTWMGDSTKEKALEKLASFNKKIGYPDKWKDYSSVEITDNLVQNVINARIFGFKEMADKLGQPVDKDEWHMTPQTVNAYYSSSQNEIVFPAGILQPPFYDKDADAALNYGGIGAVIGHEFTHGFDDQGSKYDSEGNLKNWWTDADRVAFDERANKVVEQFNGFEALDSVFVNGKLTLGENIADLGGLILAYHAMEKSFEGKEVPAKIDGFTPQQRFFLGWAQVWHMNMTEEELRNRIITDPHSPGEYRVKGPLANLSEFSEAFGCDANSPMVAKDSVRAVIW